MLDADGKPMRYVVIHENISDRIRLEKELGEKNENLRELYDNFQSRLEMQRKRIAADLHDNLLQDLAAHNMKLAKLKKLYNNDQVSEEMQEAITHVSTMIKTARNILDSIWPTILDNQGIEAAIRVYSEQFSERFHIKVNLDIQEGLNIENEISYPLYMIFQEALTNIAKHARAGKVLISLKQKKDNIHFVISDNGKGFDENNDTEKKTFGLFMIKDLVNSLGGSYEYKKGKKNITLLDILIPINKTKKI
jgi:signal transduction histidine kinase